MNYIIIFKLTCYIDYSVVGMYIVKTKNIVSSPKMSQNLNVLQYNFHYTVLRARPKGSTKHSRQILFGAREYGTRYDVHVLGDDISC